MGPLQALAQSYYLRLGWTMALSHLGVAGAVRHTTKRESLPDPMIEEFSTRTKDRNVLCVEIMQGEKRELVPLMAPCGYIAGDSLAKDLIKSGVHPLDIIIATESDGKWTFRNSVEWMFWTHEDQQKLEAHEANDAR